MKKLLTVLLITIVSFTANANETNYGDDTKVKGYIGADIKFTNDMDDDLSVLLGLKFGISIYEQLGMGIGGWLTVPGKDFTHKILPLDRDFTVDFGYGGIYFEYIYNPDNLLHFNVNCIIGVGQTSVSTEFNEDCTPSYSNEFGLESFGVIEPGIQLEVNFFTWMKVAFGGSYRYLYEFGKFYDYEKSDYEGFSGILTFRFSSKF